MKTNRRDFLRLSAAAGGVLGLGMLPTGLSALPLGGAGVPAPGGTRSGDGAPARRLRILLLGGTGFIGPWQVRRILEGGHELALFNRGRTQPRLFPELFREVEGLVGDRDGDLRALEGSRTWDVVIDNSGYTPEQVRASAALLRDRADLYLFISTQSVYASRAEIGIDETAPVGMSDAPDEEWDGYGPLKALAEREVRAAFGDRSAIVRPGIVAGPGDRTDRFTYWPVRLDRGGEVLAPNTPDDPVQFIDVRDLAEFMVHLVERDVRETFNVVGPEGELSLAGFLHGIRAVTSTPSELTFVPYEFLQRHGVRPWSDMPVWQPPVGATAGFARMSRARAIAAGLTYRPLAETAGDTLEWWKSRPEEEREPLRTGIAPEREAEVLAAWGRAGGTRGSRGREGSRKAGGSRRARGSRRPRG